MEFLRSVFIPKMVKDQSLLPASIDASICFPYGKPDLRDTYQAKRSLNRFLKDQGEQIDDVMEAFRKQDAGGVTNSFSLSSACTTTGHISYKKEGRSSFYQDGIVGFGISINAIKGESPAWDIYSSIDIHRSGLPIIIQMQSRGLGRLDDRREQRINDLFGNYRWEHALIFLWSEWAAGAGFSSVYVLPSAQNKWLRSGNKERFKMRYDVSARRMGFRTDENGIYKLDFQDSCLEK